MFKESRIVDAGEIPSDEDEIKAYRGIHWAWFTLIMMIVIAGLLLITGVIKLNLGNGPEPGPERQGSETVK